MKASTEPRATIRRNLRSNADRRSALAAADRGPLGFYRIQPIFIAQHMLQPARARGWRHYDPHPRRHRGQLVSCSRGRSCYSRLDLRAHIPAATQCESSRAPTGLSQRADRAPRDQATDSERRKELNGSSSTSTQLAAIGGELYAQPRVVGHGAQQPVPSWQRRSLWRRARTSPLAPPSTSAYRPAPGTAAVEAGTSSTSPRPALAFASDLRRRSSTGVRRRAIFVSQACNDRPSMPCARAHSVLRPSLSPGCLESSRLG